MDCGRRAPQKFRRSKPVSWKCVVATMAGPTVVERLVQEPKLGQDSTKLGRLGSQFGKVWPIQPRHGTYRPDLADLGQSEADVGQYLGNFGQHSPIWAKCWPMLTKSCPKVGHARSVLAELSQMLANNRLQRRQTWALPNVGHQTRLRSGPARPTCVDSGSLGFRSSFSATC